MGKPLTTLGEALMAQGIDWRSEMRVENVPRRPPPESKLARPDRGHIEQPGEASPPSERRPEYADKPPEKTFIRRRIEDSAATSSPVALMRPNYTPGDRDVFPPTPREPLPLAVSPVSPPPANDAPAPLRAEPPRIEPPRAEPAQQTFVRLERAEPPFAPPPVPLRPVYAKRATYTLDFKFGAVERVRRGEGQKQVADELGISPSLISHWSSGHGFTRNRREPKPFLAIEAEERDMPAKATKRHHPPEVKADAIRRLLLGEESAQAIAASHGITSAQLYKWRQRYRETHGNRLPKAPPASQAAPALANGASNGSSKSEGGLLDRLIEARLEKRLEEMLESKLTEVLERKLGKL